MGIIMSSSFTFIKQFLFIDSKTKQISHTKFWSNVGHAIMCGAFAFCVYKGVATTELWFVFGTLVMGNATANKILNMRFGVKAEDNPSNEVK